MSDESDQTNNVQPLPVECVLDAIHTFSQMALYVSVEDVRRVVVELEHTASAMPILDPTAWREIAGNYEGHERLARAFLVFRQELERIAIQPGR